MKKKFPSLFFGAISIICAYFIVAMTPIYVSDVRNLYGHLTFIDIDWGLTALNTLLFSFTTFFMLALATDMVICACLAYKNWGND